MRKLEMVSVIIPVYNAEKHLSACLDSVIGQTYTNLQIILIDDGSTDRSGEICSLYAQKDSRVKVICQENSGPSAARNNGIQQAQGEYLMFVDADDQLLPMSIQILVRSAEQNHAELVFGGYRDQSVYGEVDIYEFDNSVDTKEKLIAAILSGTGGVLWAKLFRAEVVVGNKLQLNNKVRFSEDMLFVLEYVRYIQKWSNVQFPVYLYNRQNESSLTKKRSESLITSYATFTVELKDILTKLGLDAERASAIADQKMADFVDFILMSSAHSKMAYEVLCRNQILFDAIKSENVKLSKSIKFAMQNKWAYVYMLRLKSELRLKFSIAAHSLLRMLKG